MAKEGQGYPCCQHDMMMMMIYIDIVGRVFTNDLRDRGSIPGRVKPKIKKWNLVLPCLTVSIIRYGSRVSGIIQRKE